MDETLDGIQQKIAGEMLRLVEMDWTQKTSPTNSRIFETKLGELKIVVKEDEVNFVRAGVQTNEGVIEESRSIQQVGGDGKKFKSKIHKQLCERFDTHNDIMFYKEVLRTLMENIQTEEDATPPKDGELQDAPIYLSDNKI
jgi:hypothetical protein